MYEGFPHFTIMHFGVFATLGTCVIHTHTYVIVCLRRSAHDPLKKIQLADNSIYKAKKINILGYEIAIDILYCEMNVVSRSLSLDFGTWQTPLQ